MKAALIGAGEESLHTIRKAKELGVHVIALDGNPAAQGLAAADEGLAIDISDEAAVFAALKERKPDFLLTGPIGRFLTTAGAMNDAFHLTGITRQAAVLCTDKYLFHETLAVAGLRNCQCYLVPDCGGKSSAEAEGMVDNLLQMAEELAYPAILKPRYGSGSRGIFFLNNKKELKAALETLYAQEANGTGAAEDYVLEEAAGGEEFGVDAAMDKGNLHLILLRRKLLTPPPARQAVGYMTVRREGNGVGEDGNGENAGGILLDRTEAYLNQIVQALGLTDCLLHADLMITEDAIFVIELSARPSGHNLHNLFTPMVTGVDMAENYIRSRCGLPYSYEPKKTLPALIRYFDLPEGTVTAVPKREELKLPEGVRLRAWECEIRPGDHLEPVTTGHSLMGRGYFILEGVTEEQLAEAADGVKEQFKVQ